MYIIIIGCGGTGTALAKHLISEEHEIVIVERDEKRAKELAESMDKPRWLAQQMAYCLRYMGAVQQVGKRRNAILYVRAAA